MDALGWPVVRSVPQGTVVYHSYTGQLLYCTTCSSEAGKREARMLDRPPQTILGDQGQRTGQNQAVTQATDKEPARNTYHVVDTLTAFKAFSNSPRPLWALHTL